MCYKYKILWVEDGALAELAYLAGPVYIDGRYDLFIAQNASDAVEALEGNEFNAVIIDVRLPPGKNKEWNTLYKRAAYQKESAKLGIELLTSMLKPEDSVIKIGNIDWLTATKVAIFTVENKSDLQHVLNEFRVGVYKQKTANIPESTLIDIIKQITENQTKHS